MSGTKKDVRRRLSLYLVGRGNLNRVINVLILIEFGGFSFRLEYLLESESVIGKGVVPCDAAILTGN